MHILPTQRKMNSMTGCSFIHIILKISMIRILIKPKCFLTAENAVQERTESQNGMQSVNALQQNFIVRNAIMNLQDECSSGKNMTVYWLRKKSSSRTAMRSMRKITVIKNRLSEPVFLWLCVMVVNDFKTFDQEIIVNLDFMTAVWYDRS